MSLGRFGGAIPRVRQPIQRADDPLLQIAVQMEQQEAAGAVGGFAGPPPDLLAGQRLDPGTGPGPILIHPHGAPELEKETRNICRWITRGMFRFDEGASVTWSSFATTIAHPLRQQSGFSTLLAKGETH